MLLLRRCDIVIGLIFARFVVSCRHVLLWNIAVVCYLVSRWASRRHVLLRNRFCARHLLLWLLLLHWFVAFCRLGPRHVFFGDRRVLGQRFSFFSCSRWQGCRWFRLCYVALCRLLTVCWSRCVFHDALFLFLDCRGAIGGDLVLLRVAALFSCLALLLYWLQLHRALFLLFRNFGELRLLLFLLYDCRHLFLTFTHCKHLWLLHLFDLLFRWLSLFGLLDQHAFGSSLIAAAFVINYYGSLIDLFLLHLRLLLLDLLLVCIILWL